MLRLWLRSLLSIDLRTLALFRVWVGIVALIDVINRSFTAREFLSNDGVLPNHYSLFNPPFRYFSFLHACSTYEEVMCMLACFAGGFVLLILGQGGFKVRLFCLLAAVSIIARNIWVENGGHIVLNLLLLWGLFLPLDRRFSLPRYSEWLKANQAGTSYRTFRAYIQEDWNAADSHCSLLVFGVYLSIACIYGFNFLAKSGETWASGTAVYYALWMNERATSLAHIVRQIVPFAVLKYSSLVVLWFEGLVPVLIFMPGINRYTRMFAAFGICVLHIAIGLSLTIGFFSWIMLANAILLAPLSHREDTGRSVKSPLRNIVFRESLAVVLIYTVATHSLFTYQQFMGQKVTYVPAGWTNIIVDYLRVPQNWRMFSYDAPNYSQRTVRVGLNSDGRQIDLDTGRRFHIDRLESYFTEVQDANYVRLEFDSRIPFLPSPDYYRFLSDYLKRQYPNFSEFWVYHLKRPTSYPESSESIETEVNLIGHWAR